MNIKVVVGLRISRCVGAKRTGGGYPSFLKLVGKFIVPVHFKSGGFMKIPCKVKLQVFC